MEKKTSKIWKKEESRRRKKNQRKCGPGGRNRMAADQHSSSTFLDMNSQKTGDGTEGLERHKRLRKMKTKEKAMNCGKQEVTYDI